jgi:hypothetical protein
MVSFVYSRLIDITANILTFFLPFQKLPPQRSSSLQIREQIEFTIIRINRHNLKAQEQQKSLESLPRRVNDATTESFNTIVPPKSKKRTNLTDHSPSVYSTESS